MHIADGLDKLECWINEGQIIKTLLSNKSMTEYMAFYYSPFLNQAWAMLFLKVIRYCIVGIAVQSILHIECIRIKMVLVVSLLDVQNQIDDNANSV